MPEPLKGIKVIDLAEAQQGPVAATILGDLGADVIKVERKEGDRSRGFMTIAGIALGLKGRNFYFEHMNRNKRSIAIDLKQEKGREILFKLIDDADVFVTNMRIGAPERLGISYEVLQNRNPRLIYAHASGWGPNGPDATDGANDFAAIARGGLMMICGEKGAGPAQIGTGLADELGGIMCAFGVCIALLARGNTGKGQRVDTSLLGSLMALESLHLSGPAMLGKEWPRQIRTEVGNPLFNYYKCLDEKWIVITHPESQRYWPKVCKVMGMADLETDPRFDSVQSRGMNRKELIAILDEKIASKNRDEWIRIFKEEDLIYASIQTTTEVVNDPQALANDYIVSYDHPALGQTKMIGFPWALSDTKPSIRREPPELGQHTEEILLAMGYTWDDITKLKEDGTIN